MRSPCGSHCVDENAILLIAGEAVVAAKKYRLLKRENTEELKRIAVFPLQCCAMESGAP
jgi:hypothetical protein